MLRKSLLITLLLITTNLIAQKPFYTTYDWEPNPTYKITDTSKDLIALKEKIVDEFIFEGKDFVEYFIEHRVLWLNSDDAIEEYNKIYLPLNSNSSLLASKARVIKKSGEVIELDKSKILTADDEETGRKYRYFALEGVEKGSFIEYFYIQKRPPSYSGKKLNFQGKYEKNNIEFDLYSPRNLEFQFKSYNGLSNVVIDTTYTEKLHWSLRMDKLDGLDNEFKAPYNASKAFLVYKLHKNKYGDQIITSYATVAKNVHSYYYKELDKKTLKELDKFIATIGINNEGSIDEKIRTLDRYIKSNLYYSKGYSDSLEDLKTILSNKTANERGTVKLFTACLTRLNIQHEIVLTSDRMQLKFDRVFESNNFLQEFLLYFPKTKKYLSPNNFNSRYGFPPPMLMDNYGLFISKIPFGENSTAIAKVKYINALKAKESTDNMQVEISFDKEDLTTNKIQLTHSMSGYYALYIQPYLDLILPDKKDDVLNAYAKNVDKNAEIEKRVLTNDKPELFGVKPLIFDYTITSDSFVEKAGNKYLFKLGDLIGPQMEMYQEKKRVLPYENDFNRSYYRTIKIEIPEGYKISNLKDINIENRYKDNDRDLYSFHSFYKLEGNTLEVTANEHYHENIVPKELYEEFRKVINSAADFNKITLILEPK